MLTMNKWTNEQIKNMQESFSSRKMHDKMDGDTVTGASIHEHDELQQFRHGEC